MSQNKRFSHILANEGGGGGGEEVGRGVTLDPYMWIFQKPNFENVIEHKNGVPVN